MHNSYISNSLISLFWDANGLKNHKNELLLTLQEKRIDIILISETKLTTNLYVNLLGYDSYRANQPDNTAHAGAAIYIKYSLKYISLPNFISDKIQSLLFNNIPITFSAVYCPPKNKISPTKLTEFLSTLNNHFIIGGDLNAKQQKLGCRASNPRGNTLLQSLQTTNYTVFAPPNYIYWPNCRRTGYFCH
jgi:exonuclease III